MSVQSVQTVYRTTVDSVTVSTTDADVATRWSEAGRRVTAKTGCGL